MGARAKITLSLSRELHDRLGSLAARLGRPLDELTSELIERSIFIADIGMPSETEPVPQKDAESSGGTSPRPKRYKLTPEESLRRMKDFKNRKDEFIASIRKSKG